MSKSIEMKINDEGDFEKEQTTETKCEGGSMVNNLDEQHEVRFQRSLKNGRFGLDVIIIGYVCKITCSLQGTIDFFI